ncbi:MAG: hypothetical protein ACKO51_06820 [Alphaproteobacteria bacterium]
MANQFNTRLATQGQWCAHRHVIYQLTKCLQNSAATLTGHRLLKPLDLGAIHRGEVGMQPRRGRVTLRISDGAPQFLLALAQSIQLALKARGAKAIGNRLDQAIKLTISGLELTAQAFKLAGNACLQAVPGRREFGDKGFNRLRAHQVLPKGAEHLAFQPGTPDSHLVGANALPNGGLAGCPSSNHLRPIGGLCTGVSGPSMVEVKLPFGDASSGGAGWCCA